MEKLDEDKIVPADELVQEDWVKPAVTSYAPVRAAEGIMYLPSDGISNLTP